MTAFPTLPDSLRYRLGTRDDFLAAMVRELLARDPKAPQDPQAVDASLAVLDGWATLADVLTFYQERIAGEGFLATATEPYSLMRLAELVGVRPRPAVAAGGYLAYLVDPAADPTSPAVVPARSRVKSVPRPGETAQAFETLVDLVARPDANTPGVRQTGAPLRDDPTVYLTGTTPTPTPNDVLILPSANGSPDPRQVVSADVDATAARTRVLLTHARPEPTPEPPQDVPSDTAVLLTRRAALFGAAALPQPVIKGSQVTGYTDWSRTDLLRWGFTLTCDGTDFATTAFVAGIPGAGRVTTNLRAGALRRLRTWTLPVGDTRATFTVNPVPRGSLFPVSITFLAPRALTVTITPSPVGARVVLTLEGDTETREVAVGSTTRLLSGTSQVRIGYAPPAKGSRTLAGAPAPGVLTVETTPPSTTLLLDGNHPEVAPGSWIGIVQGDGAPVCVRSVTANETVGATGFGLVQRVSRLTLDRPWAPPPDADLTGVRAVTLYLETARRPLAGVPLDPVADALAGSAIELDGTHPALTVGRLLAVSGTTVNGTATGEVATIAAVTSPPADGPPVTLVTLAAPLAHAYRRDQATVYGNVVPATQGTTWDEVLGSGDPTTAGQSFALRQAPLTYRPAPGGIAPDVDVLVDDVAWTRVEDLSALDSDARGYVVDTDEKGAATIRFGDGVHGARASAGVENVRAVYRSGAGAAGNVAVGQLSQLQSRPAGVTAVTNPVDASGGVDQEAPSTVRARAAVGVGALGRLVGLVDYADVARSTPGIGKADCRLLPVAGTSTVVVTVGLTTAAPPDPQSSLIRSLEQQFIDASADPARQVIVLPRRLFFVCLRARIRIAPDRTWDRVRADALSALTAGYGYAVQELGGSLRLADLTVTLMQVPGVDWVVVDQLSAVGEDAPAPPPSPSPPPDELPGAPAEVTASGLQAAALLVLDPARPLTVQLEPLP